jgi:hypothetical protein
MNRQNRSRRPAPKKKEIDTIESVCDRLDRIGQRIGRIDNCDSISKAHAQELVFIASHILNTSPDPDADEDHDEESESDDNDDEDPDSLPPSSRPRLDLRKRWAGSLPTVDSFAASKQRKAPEGPEESVKLTPKEYLKLQKRNAERIAALKDTNGIAGGHPDVYDTTYDFSPNHVCQCGSKLIDHKVDKNLPVQQTSEGPMQAYILCDRTRAYIPVP